MYQETQRFRQKWLWALLGGVFAVSVGMLGWGLVTQIVLGKPWGTRPIPDGALVGISVAVFGLDVALFALFVAMRLVVTVDEQGIRVRFAPFATRVVRFADVKTFFRRPVAPMREYGGLGIRGTRKHRAYLMAGGEGVELVLQGGDRLFLGSLRAKELEDAIARASGKVAGEA